MTKKIISLDDLKKIGSGAEMIDNRSAKSSQEPKAKNKEKNSDISHPTLIYVDKQTKEDILFLSKKMNLSMGNLVKKLENIFYQNATKYISTNEEELPLSVDELVSKHNKKYDQTISVLTDYELTNSRAKEKNYKNIQEYFRDIFKFLLPEVKKALE